MLLHSWPALTSQAESETRVWSSPLALYMYFSKTMIEPWTVLTLNTLIAVKAVVYRSHRWQARVTKKKKKKEKCVLIQIRNPLCSLAHTVNQISQNQQINNTISDVLKRLCKTLTVFYCFILKQWVFALKKSENSIFSFY